MPLIVLCGLDGAGKTTQLARLCAWLGETGYAVVQTRQPTPWYREDADVRAFFDYDLTGPTITAELALFSAADRLRHCREVIAPALDRGDVVVSDRYVYSALAYFTARGIDDMDWLCRINRFAPPPDLAFFLDVPSSVSVGRVVARGEPSKTEELDTDRMTVVRQTYLDQRWIPAFPPLAVLDGTLPPDVLATEIRTRVDAVLTDTLPKASERSTVYAGLNEQ